MADLLACMRRFAQLQDELFEGGGIGKHSGERPAIVIAEDGVERAVFEAIDGERQILARDLGVIGLLLHPARLGGVI